MDMNQYLEIFVEESKDHLQNLNESLLSLEKNPKDKKLLDEIFRVAHTIKGMGGTMGFMKVTNLTHEMENLLDSIRNNLIEVNPDIIDTLFECLDMLEEYINTISENGEEGKCDSSLLVNTLNEIIKGEVAVASDVIEGEDIHLKHDEYVMNIVKTAQEKGLSVYDITVTLDKECVLKSARAFLIFNTLEDNCEIVQSIPPVEDIEDEKFDFSFSMTVVSKLNDTQIKKELYSISEVENVAIHEITILDMKKSLLQKNKDLSVEEVQEDLSGELTQNNKKRETKKLGKTVRVDIDRLDNLMNLVSELIIIKTRMEDMGGSSEKQNMNEAIEYLERITTNLHDAVMKVRMVPIERVFNRFPRMVRDLSKELGKEISLEMSGEETEVDRTVIDEIGDPLIHLIRNSIDHGIEDPDRRRKMGKDQTGIVKLRAYPDGNNVVIEVEDDGDGIDLESIRKKAATKGLISKDNINNIPDEDAVELLFQPGFSTAEKITDISGRGVGLDVVKTKIEAIGGNVEVETVTGQGTKFTIRLPLTLAIIQALLVNIGEEIYAIPLSSIKEISPIISKDIRKVQNQEIVLFRNKTLPIIRLHKVLGLEEKENQDELIAVIVKKGDKEAGLIIDNLLGQQEIVIKSLGKYLHGIKHLAGATILGNGMISLILDVNSLF